MTRRNISVLTLTLAALFLAGTAFAQVNDPGVRTSTGVNAGQPLASVQANASDLAFFNNGLSQFNEHQTVTGDNPGLGPRFNLDSCGGCHSQPAAGGSSPSVNPQSQVIANGVVSGSTNTIPSFITASGPVREARFPFFFNANGTANLNNPNGGVETIFTVSGRADAAGCSLTQPGFTAAANANNLIFRIPTPVFGSGLMANIDDSTLLNNQAAQAGNAFGVAGAFNHNGNDGTISRFGWKAQNKSLMIFSGEAYNVEMGISNELFQQDRPLPGEDGNGGTGQTGLPASCLNLAHVGYPEDITHSNGTDASSSASDVTLFAVFMEDLAPPTPSTTVPGGSTSIARGRTLFTQVGCAVCHTPSLTTQPSHLTAGLGNATANLFSDLEVHHMGTGLADNVSQGGAGGDQFRSAPLWGLGQRIFFLHDGRTNNLVTVINDHGSNGSEANASLNAAAALSLADQQNLINFLRSL
ncbi:MAG TPA: di-heme oxidoredictase family protein [Candidatus Angelobacter sp.]|nr:di-heme oxidoredictase family protein [Candidatus Angelobacter sp.]